MKNSLSVTVIVAVIVGVAFTAIQLTPKPMSSDLSLIKAGKPSVVLAYENFSPTGGAALARLKDVRPDYEAALNFIVADLGTPQGRAFASRHGLVDGQAVLLDRDGNPFAVTGPQASEQRLREDLDKVIASGR